MEYKVGAAYRFPSVIKCYVDLTAGCVITLYKENSMHNRYKNVGLESRTGEH